VLRNLAWGCFAFLVVYSVWPAEQQDTSVLDGGFEVPRYFEPELSIERAPLQTRDVPGIVLRTREFTVTPVARFQIEARVLGRQDYSRGTEALLSPMDLALGWGPMANPDVLQHIPIRQSNRFYFWSAQKLPIPRRQIETHSANMHLIPADDSVREALASVRAHQTIRMLGLLVNVDGPDGWRWRTSLSREDTGPGACEILLVQRVEIR
jgi:hypothetical protein